MKRINVFIGKNAQGKTNFIEAIYLLGALRSFRGSKKEDIIMKGKDSSTIVAEIGKYGLTKDLELNLSKDKKNIRVNHHTVSHMEDYYRDYRVVTFTPDDTMLIKGLPEERRNFLNRGIVTYNPIYYRVYRNFSKALDSKKMLLKNDRVQKNDLRLWNKELAKYSAPIYIERESFINALNERIAPIYEKISHKKDSLCLTYIPSSGLIDVSLDIKSETFQDDLENLLNGRLDEEIFSRHCLISPTRDDIAFSLKDLSAKNYASQGEIKTIILALKIAHLEHVYSVTGEYPVFLLDDISSELDETRRSFLMKYLQEKNIQIFLTTTKFDNYLQDMNSNDYSLYKVEEGKIIHYVS